MKYFNNFAPNKTSLYMKRLLPLLLSWAACSPSMAQFNPTNCSSRITNPGTENPQLENSIINQIPAQKEAVIHTITGMRVKNVTKPGIYIINGKKYFKR
jgi:hypothetical protein